MGVWVTVVLIGAIALPSLARKKKMQPVGQQQQTVRVDSLSPNNRKRYDYFLTEAARQHAAGNYSAAFDLYEHARNIDPNSATANYYLSLYLTEMKQDSLGLLRLQKAIEQDPENLIFAERLAQYYISKGKYEDAINAYEAVYAKNHSNTDVLRVLAQLYQQQKNFKMMLNTVSRLETEEGESEQFTLTKMRIHEMMDDKKAAYNELKSLVEQHPLDMQYKTMLGNWLMQHDRQKEAFKYFTDVLKEEPDNSYAQMSLYDYYNATKQTDLANGMLDKILMSQKTDIQTKIMMFRSFIQNNETEGGDSTKVIALFDKVLNVPQPSSEIAEVRAAYMSLKKMPTDSVISAFKKVLDIAPDNANARIQTIQLLWNQKKYHEVIEQAKAAHEYNPEEMIFYYFGGMAYYQNKDEDAALNEFRLGVAQVNKLSANDLVSDLYAVMGDILHQKNQKDAAFAAYDSCLQWKADNVMALNNYAYYLSEEGKDLHKAEAMSYKTIKLEPNNGTYLDTYAWILFMEERYVDAKTYIDAALKNRDSTENNSTVYRTVILGRIPVLESRIDIGLGIYITLFHKQNPGVGIKIGTIVRFQLDGLVAHRLSLVQILAFLAQIVGVVVERHYVVGFPLQTGIIGCKGCILLILLMQDVAHHGIEIRNQVVGREFIHLSYTQPELIERRIFVLILIVSHTSEIIEDHLFRIVFVGSLRLLDHLMIFLLIPEQLNGLDARIGIVWSDIQHLFEG